MDTPHSSTKVAEPSKYAARALRAGLLERKQRLEDLGGPALPHAPADAVVAFENLGPTCSLNNFKECRYGSDQDEYSYLGVDWDEQNSQWDAHLHNVNGQVIHTFSVE